jgi:hypothetical protein
VASRTHITLIGRNSQYVGTKLFAERCFAPSESPRMKKGPAALAGPKISKAPYLYERNPCYGKCTI